jgi:hypothetical protein
MKGISKWKGIEELFMEEWKAGIFLFGFRLGI